MLNSSNEIVLSDISQLSITENVRVYIVMTEEVSQHSKIGKFWCYSSYIERLSYKVSAQAFLYKDKIL